MGPCALLGKSSRALCRISHPGSDLPCPEDRYEVSTATKARRAPASTMPWGARPPGSQCMAGKPHLARGDQSW